MASDFQADIDAIDRIPAIPAILEVICRTTGMGFAAVARVTEARWICCAVRDEIAFGLVPGGELKVETTICNEIRQSLQAVVINEVARDDVFRGHPTPAQYGFQSYLSMPILLPDGRMFGTLCAIDPRPARLNTPAVLGMFRLFAELIAFHLDAHARVALSEARLTDERKLAELREQFVAVLGHDLRNPLASIAAGIQLLRKRPDPAVYAMMDSSVERMSGLIDNVMDMARGRLGGGLLLFRTPLQMASVISQVVSELQSAFPERLIDVSFVLPQAVEADRGRIAQLLSNLLGNALAYGDADKPVHVRAAMDATDLTLSVANAGKPIPPDAMTRLFQPFTRGSAEGHKPGLGLGLYIASEIARAHDGRIDVASTSEETRFTFTMPLTERKELAA
ncbi:GAF domain-containing sensor histidine kinase [Bradyrhizobium prioriisuperbiae]|uniref:GAF domain-containing sensor histidine kinase n=1 Tax=Bradyrhizobium prioriisuperbiae TaxID=2854389 RepID=UPI0028E97B15|nr:GAF domain-containing sensor histidine kinase [Bradyrhizobium prioritasuperba]